MNVSHGNTPFVFLSPTESSQEKPLREKQDTGFPRPHLRTATSRAVLSALAAATLIFGTPAFSQSTTESEAASIEALQEQNQELLERINSLHSKLGLSSGDNPWLGYQNQIASLESELGDVRAKLGQAEIRLLENEKLVARLRKQHDARVLLLQQRMLEAAVTLNDRKKAAADAADEQAALHQQALDAKNDELKQAMQEKEVELQSASDAFKAAEQMSASLQEESDSRIAELGQELGTTTADLAAANNQLANQIEQNEQNLGKLGKLEMDLKESSDALEKVKSDNDSLRRQLADANTSIGFMEESLDMSKAAGDKEANRLFALNSRLTEQLQQAEENKRKFGETLVQANRERELLAEKLQQQNEARTMLASSLDETQSIAEIAKERNLKLTRFAQKMAIELANTSVKEREMAERGQALESELQLAKADLDNAMSANQQLESQMAASQQQHEALMSESQSVLAAQKAASEEELMTKVAATEQAFKDMALAEQQRLVQEHDASYSALNQELIASLDQQAALISQRDDLTSVVGDMEKIAALRSEELAESASRGDKLEEELAALKQQLAAPGESAKSIKSALEKSLDSHGVENTEISIRPDNTVALRVPNELLFQSGRARLSSAGRALIGKVGMALDESIGENHLRVEGHTDSVPVGKNNSLVFPSNWELSVARSANAVSYLQLVTEIDPTQMTAMGYGEYRPLAENTSVEGRAENRRIEIVVVPQ